MVFYIQMQYIKKDKKRLNDFLMFISTEKLRIYGETIHERRSL